MTKFKETDMVSNEQLWPDILATVTRINELMTTDIFDNQIAPVLAIRVVMKDSATVWYLVNGIEKLVTKIVEGEYNS